MTKEITKPKKKTIVDYLLTENFKKQVALALPKHLSPDRFLRLALTELRKNEKLMKCDPKSFLGAIVQCSQLGLEPGDNLGRVYLIPFENKRTGIIECQVIIGYRGLLDLARRPGQISSISAHCVYANDFFAYQYGLDEKLKHIPSQEARGDFLGAYAIAKFKDGGYQFEVMFKEGIEHIRKTSKGAQTSYSPWNDAPYGYQEMARKTVLRRLCKYLPMSIETQEAITIDEKGDVGKQDLSRIIDGSFFEEEETPQEVPTPTTLLKEKLNGNGNGINKYIYNGRQNV